MAMIGTPTVVEVRKFRRHEGWVGFNYDVGDQKDYQSSGKTWPDAETNLRRSLKYHYGDNFIVKVVIDCK